MRVKICGLMRAQDVKSAVDYGADAAGFVVVSPQSPRNLALNKVQKLIDLASVFVTAVAVTSASDIQTLHRICSKLHPDAIQLHQYDRQTIRRLRREYPELKIILGNHIRNVSSVNRAESFASLADATLADSPSHTGMGGTGRTHDWTLSATLRKRIYPRPLILAGGLTPGNVREAINRVKPYGVDVSTGVERRIGAKDDKKIEDFISRAKGDFS